MEHKLIQGGEQYLPFARSRIKALRATGLSHASQQFEIDGVSVKVRTDGEHNYINIQGGQTAFWMMVNLRHREYSYVDVKTKLYRIEFDPKGKARVSLKYEGRTTATASTNIPVDTVTAPALFQFFASKNTVAGMAWTNDAAHYVGFPDVRRDCIYQGVGKIAVEGGAFTYGYQHKKVHYSGPGGFDERIVYDDVIKKDSWPINMAQKPALVGGSLYYSTYASSAPTVFTRRKISLGGGDPIPATDWAPAMGLTDGAPTGPGVLAPGVPDYTSMDAGLVMHSDKAIWLPKYNGNPQFDMTAYSLRGAAGYVFPGRAAPLTDRAYFSRSSDYNIWQWFVTSISGVVTPVHTTRLAVDLRTLPGISTDPEFLAALNYTYAPTYPPTSSDSIYEGNGFCYADKYSATASSYAVHITMQVDQKSFPDILVPETIP